MKKKVFRIIKRILLVIVVIAVLAGSVVLWVMASAPKAVVPTATTNAGKRDIIQIEGSVGTVESKNNYDIVSDSKAPIKDICVAIGDMVNEGDVIYVLDDKELKIQLDEYKKLYDNAVEAEKLNKDLSEKNKLYLEQSRKAALQKAEAEYNASLQSENMIRSQLDDYRHRYNEAALAKEIFEGKYRELCEKYPDVTEIFEEMSKKNKKPAQEQESTERPTEKAPEQPTESTSEAEEAEDETPELPEMPEIPENVIDQAVISEFVQLSLDIADSTSKCETYQAFIAAAERELKAAESNTSDYEYILDLSRSEENSDELDRKLDNGIIKMYRNRMDDVEAELKKLERRSPVSGIVTSISAVEGVPFTYQNIMTISDPTSKVIKAQAAPEKKMMLSPGMKVVMTSDVTGSAELTGVLTEVSNVCVDGKYTIMITPDPDFFDDLFYGMSVYSRIVINERRDVLAVPYESIASDAGGSFVYVQNEEGGYDRKAVETGLESSYYTEITGGELREGDIVLRTAAEMAGTK